MKKPSFIQKLKDVSITKKLYFTVGIMAVLIVFELASLWFSIHTLSSVRAFVGAEGLWSKAQKDAIYYLHKYYRTHNEKDYITYKNFLSVQAGDHKTRMELLVADPDMSVARQGLVEGRVHPDDIDGMIKLFRRFNKISYINKAIIVWAKADSIIGKKFIPLAEEMHNEITSANPSQEKLDIFIEELDPINEELTYLEDEFSYTLGEGSRWLENLILKLLFAVALTVEITGLLITVSVSRSIGKGLKEINRAANKIADGDLTERSQVFSKDEIGQVAVSINQMTERLVNSNKELEQFAYITSHDLQEPLRSISIYVELFQLKYKNKIDEDADQYLSAIVRSTSRMQLLIKDMLEYSRIGHDDEVTIIYSEVMVKNVLNDLSALIKETNTKVIIDDLPVINSFSELKLVFQNLIANAIKFRNLDIEPVIHVSAKDNLNEWQFSVKDNGIGIEKEYFDRIFVIFQRLHSQKDYSGSGIGLAHCKKIVEMHGGNIFIESVPGKGSIFHFTIPKNIKSDKKA
ncbi:MAG: ATP-binding protein [Bacteroidota bacterium]